MLNNKKLSNKFDALKALRKFKNEPLEDSGPVFSGFDVPNEEQWKLFLKLCDVLYEKER